MSSPAKRSADDGRPLAEQLSHIAGIGKRPGGGWRSPEAPQIRTEDLEALEHCVLQLSHAGVRDAGVQEEGGLLAQPARAREAVQLDRPCFSR